MLSGDIDIVDDDDDDNTRDYQISCYMSKEEWDREDENEFEIYKRVKKLELSQFKNTFKEPCNLMYYMKECQECKKQCHLSKLITGSYSQKRDYSREREHEREHERTRNHECKCKRCDIYFDRD